jgi:hypothetical protein
VNGEQLLLSNGHHSEIILFRGFVIIFFGFWYLSFDIHLEFEL